MAKVAIGLGILLILLGVGGYAVSGGASITALIPAFFGRAFLALGFIARKQGRRKHAMHAAAALGLLGFLGSVRGLVGLVTLLSGGAVDRPAAVVAQSVMALLCAVFVVLCVKSFIDARRGRVA